MLHSSPTRISPVLLLAAALSTPQLDSPFVALAQTPVLAPTAAETNTPAAQQVPTATAPSPDQLPLSAEDEGDAYLAHHRYHAAIDAYHRIAQPSAVVWNKMGVAYQLLFDPDDAQRCYEKAHKLDPHNAVVINNLGSLAMAAHHYGSAQKLYHKAVKLDARNPLYHKNLGTAYLADRRYKKGWESYRAALAIDPNVFSRTTGVRVENPSTVQERGALNYYMARGCLLAGKTQQAIEYLRLALNEGYVTPKKLLSDNEFAGLHDLPAFQQLMESNAARR